MSRTVRDIIAWLEQRKGQSLNRDEGVMFGDPAREITGVTICWMPTVENIAAAAAQRHELLIHHESFLHPCPLEQKQDLHTLRWPVNTQRLGALAKGNLVATRLHGTIDELWIYDEFAERLGLTQVCARGQGYCDRVFEIEPTPLEELVARVKRLTPMPAVRRTNVKPGRIVRKIGLPWGGLGLFVNVGYVQRLLDLAPDIDVMIAGETDAYGFRFCTELGIDVIETSHEISENAGLGRFAEALSKQFPHLDVCHVADAVVWSVT